MKIIQRPKKRGVVSGSRHLLLSAITAAATMAGAAQSQAANTPLADAIPALIPQGAITANLVKIARGFVAPVTTAVAPGDEDHLYVVDQVGKLYAVPLAHKHHGAVPATLPDPTLVLDVSARLVSPLGLFGLHYDERGFLGAAFHPNFRKNGLLYTFTSEPATAQADFPTPLGATPNNQTVITEWHATRASAVGHHDDGDDDADEDNGPIAVDPNSARVLLRIDKPQFNHDGGTLAFGRDGLLYITLGDGGNANDFGPGHAPGGNAQSLDNVLGKILRIDPLGNNSANKQYGIPSDNPFVGKDGLDEIWAYGLRNAYRVSFDKKTGALLIADVGQNDVEEIDIGKSGANYGWPVKEGTFLFDNNGGGVGGFVFADSPGAPAGLVDPIAQYDHKDTVGGKTASARIAIIGGYVYRGEKNKSLRGRYIFGDYNTAFFSPQGGHVYYLDSNKQVQELRFSDGASFGAPVLGFGQDSEGEVYVLSNPSGVILGTDGAVYRIDEVKKASDKKASDKKD